MGRTSGSSSSFSGNGAREQARGTAEQEALIAAITERVMEELSNR